MRESSFWQRIAGKYCHVLLYYILGDPAEVSQPGCTSETPGGSGQKYRFPDSPPGNWEAVGSGWGPGTYISIIAWDDSNEPPPVFETYW